MIEEDRRVDRRNARQAEKIDARVNRRLMQKERKECRREIDKYKLAAQSRTAAIKELERKLKAFAW